MNWERRLSPVTEDALAVLSKAADDGNDSLSKDNAKALLTDDDRFTHGDVVLSISSCR